MNPTLTMLGSSWINVGEVFIMLDRNNEELDIDNRRKMILKLIDTEGKVKVTELSKLFGISDVTVRNDLTELEVKGLLERVHGGAIGTNKSYSSMSLIDRMKTNEKEKRDIAAVCASMITEGDTVMINSGTTCFFIMQELKHIKNLTVVTNSITIANEAGNSNNIYVILLGGNFNTRYQFTYGDDAVNQLKRYKADKCILSVDGVNTEEGITTYHHQEVEVNRQMMTRVNKTVVTADYSKIGRSGFALISGVDSIDILVTNEKASQIELNNIRQKGVEVRLV